ncbi:hypothetical protein CHF27_006055 [Romboutsia maritimum]|uniref:Uncharacterized protein n=1 Tax=Romboutsia maritimum TaxID=2020948 RepID=A0A371ITV1_9FIRM|nr:hypothetical protein [Romboutsia maritimum]RDY23914.1 hypothetical protein CHF27_006055 [Romboutsia maritimum]
MDKVKEKRVAENPNIIKFIGVGYKGIDILNKIANNKKEYIGLATIDIKENKINENIKENIVFTEEHFKGESLQKEGFFKITDAINKHKDNLYKLIKKERLVLMICDVCDLVAVHILIELGKIAKMNDTLVIPIIINTQKSNNINYKFFIKKINRCIGPSVIISNNKVFGNIKFTNDTIDDYYIIDSILNLFIENMIATCSVYIDYEDVEWLFNGNDNVEMSIIKVNEKSSEEDMRYKLIKNRICKGTYELPKKIIINATANKKYINYDKAFKIIQKVAQVIEAESDKDCKITFSLKFTQEENKSIEILTIKA